MALRIDEEFKALIPPLSDDERAMLAEKVIREGCIFPLITWENDPEGESLIDGHNRAQICRENGKGYKTHPMKFRDRSEVRLWMLRNQLSRRNLTDDQRAMVADRIIEEQSGLKRSERAKKAVDVRENILSAVLADKIESDEKRDTRKEVSEAAKVSEKKVRAARNVRKQSPELADKVLSGEVTLRQATAEIKKSADAPELQQPSEPLVPLDANGTPLPDVPELRAAFALNPEAEEMMREISGIKSRVREFAAKAPWISSQEVEIHLKNARHAIKHALPYALCPYCKGSGGGKTKCSGCNGHRWATKVNYDTAPSEMKV